MKENWYCASYSAFDNDGQELFPDPDYFKAKNDEEAIEYAKEYAKMGENYADIGHIDKELLSVCKVDPDNEWEETETIWY